MFAMDIHLVTSWSVNQSKMDIDPFIPVKPKMVRIYCNYVFERSMTVAKIFSKDIEIYIFSKNLDSKISSRLVFY